MPAMPTRFIHSRSAVMPSLVTLPFSQCHQTRGRAEAGGSRKPRSRASADGGAGDWATRRARDRRHRGQDDRAQRCAGDSRHLGASRKRNEVVLAGADRVHRAAIDHPLEPHAVGLVRRTAALADESRAGRRHVDAAVAVGGTVTSSSRPAASAPPRSRPCRARSRTTRTRRRAPRGICGWNSIVRSPGVERPDAGEVLVEPLHDRAEEVVVARAGVGRASARRAP